MIVLAIKWAVPVSSSPLLHFAAFPDHTNCCRHRRCRRLMTQFLYLRINYVASLSLCLLFPLSVESPTADCLSPFQVTFCNLAAVGGGMCFGHAPIRRRPSPKRRRLLHCTALPLFPRGGVTLHNFPHCGRSERERRLRALSPLSVVHSTLARCETEGDLSKY